MTSKDNGKGKAKAKAKAKTSKADDVAIEVEPKQSAKSRAIVMPKAAKLYPVDALIPYARNARTHSEAQIAQIAASMVEFGFTNPILIDEDGGIIAGHGRVLAARKLGLAKIPCVELSHLTLIQKRAYVIADNKLALNAGWDDEMLDLELRELSESGVDLDLIGFEDFDLSDVDEGDGKDPIDQNRNLLLIELASEEELHKLFDEIQGRGFQCKIMS